MKPFYLLMAAGLLYGAVPAHSAYVLGAQTCSDPYRSGQSLAFAHRSYLNRDAQLAKEARRCFDLDENTALDALRRRFPELKLAALHIRVIHCTVYYEANSRDRCYLFDAQTLRHIPKERP